MLTKQEFINELTKIVEDYIDAGNYTNFRELTKEVKAQLMIFKEHAMELVDNEVISYDAYFSLYRMWCYIEDAFAPDYYRRRFDDEWEGDCQNVRKFYDKAVSYINES